MKALKRTAWIAGWILFSMLAAAAVSAWIPAAEGDYFRKPGLFRMSVAGLGCGIALLAAGGIILLRKTSGTKNESASGWRRLLTDAGFALLPAAAIWKAFEDTCPAGEGFIHCPESFSIPWIFEEGLFRPCRMEAAAALIFFVLFACWLVIRKEPGRADRRFTGTVLVSWAAVRMVTERFRRQPYFAIEGLSLACVIAAAVILAYGFIWCAGARRSRQVSPVVCVLFGIAMTAGVAAALTFSASLFTLGSQAADVAVIAGGTAAAYVAALSLRNDEPGE